ncbi:hypothetical protein [Hymenobacter gummosus]|nr:hypothetical protein [Hymenobacter gummosus]
MMSNLNAQRRPAACLQVLVPQWREGIRLGSCPQSAARKRG